MTPEQAAAAARPSVLDLGGAHGECPRTLRRARLIGLSGWAFYVTGRGGALGDVRAEMVAAAIGFIAPDAVADGWDAAGQVARPAEVAASNLVECCRWGVERLAGCPEVPRLLEVAQRVVPAADGAGLPLFAAWRAMPVPQDAPAARLAALLYVLRELVGGAYLVGVRAVGMSPRDALVAGDEGAAGAAAHGWPAPYPPVGPLVRRRLLAEAIGDRIVGDALAVLTPDERAEFVRLLAALRSHLRSTPTVAGPATRP